VYDNPGAVGASSGYHPTAQSALYVFLGLMDDEEKEE
jgi:hypothetical protein